MYHALNFLPGPAVVDELSLLLVFSFLREIYYFFYLKVSFKIVNSLGSSLKLISEVNSGLVHSSLSCLMRPGQMQGWEATGCHGCTLIQVCHRWVNIYFILSISGRSGWSPNLQQCIGTGHSYIFPQHKYTGLLARISLSQTYNLGQKTLALGQIG